MAKIGLRNFMFGILKEAEDGTATYGKGIRPGKAVSCSVSISNNSATLYADDTLAESDTTFQSGSLKLSVDNDDLKTQATLLGHNISDSGEIVRNANDIAPYVGLGRIITKIVGGKYEYKVEFLNKVKLAEPSQDDTTKGETIQFGTVELDGTITTLASGDWSKAQTFDSMVKAQEYLAGFFGTDTASGESK